jgi:hypothetical protein
VLRIKELLLVIKPWFNGNSPTQRLMIKGFKSFPWMEPRKAKKEIIEKFPLGELLIVVSEYQNQSVFFSCQQANNPLEKLVMVFQYRFEFSFGRVHIDFRSEIYQIKVDKITVNDQGNGFPRCGNPSQKFCKRPVDGKPWILVRP